MSLVIGDWSFRHWSLVIVSLIVEGQLLEKFLDEF
jgi:hypothetical protein